MRFFYSCYTDIGTIRAVNQDSLLVKTWNQDGHKAVLAAVCDGVGGLSQGEWASRRTAEMLSSWFDYEIPQIIPRSDAKELFSYRLRQLTSDINKEIYFENSRRGIQSGTTISVILIWDFQYMIAHAGDSRIYRIADGIEQLTQDHSWVAQEVAAGRMSPEQAEADSRKNIILKCVGASTDIQPDYQWGVIQQQTVFCICSDGFWHHIQQAEWWQMFSPNSVQDENMLGDRLHYLTELVKKRGETDNISSVAVVIR